MPMFTYRAKKGPFEQVSGEIEADSRASALAQLEARGLVPTLVELRSGGGHSRRAWRPIRPREITVLTRQISGLLRAGVPLLGALRVLADQTEHPELSARLREVADAVRDGETLSGALARYPRLFSDLYVSTVRAGESGGALDTVLERLAAAREQAEDLLRRLRAAAAYPLLVLAVGAVTVTVLLIFFLPRVAELYREPASLPLLTRGLLAFGRGFRRVLPAAVAVAGLGVLALCRLGSEVRFRTALDAVALRLPLWRRLSVQADIARWAQTLGLLLQCGVSLERALSLSAATLRNTVLRREIETVREDTLRMGRPVSDGLRRARHVPVFVAHMVGVGEHTGRLEESLAAVAAYYEKEVDHHLRVAVALLEPILILAVGSVVGLIVAGMLLPIFQMTQVLQ